MIFRAGPRWVWVWRLPLFRPIDDGGRWARWPVRVAIGTRRNSLRRWGWHMWGWQIGVEDVAPSETTRGYMPGKRPVWGWTLRLGVLLLTFGPLEIGRVP